MENKRFKRVIQARHNKLYKDYPILNPKYINITESDKSGMIYKCKYNIKHHPEKWNFEINIWDYMFIISN